MTTLSASKQRVFLDGPQNDVPVIAADIIWAGAAVGDNGSGYGRPLVAGDPFLGFAEEKADNSTGIAGDINVKLRRQGRVVLAVGSAVIGDIGKAVYASDDDTFTLTASTNSFVGRITRFISEGVVEVEFGRGQAGKQTALTDNSGGTANTTVEACGTAVTGVDGTGSNAASKADVDARLTAIANNFADLAAAVNGIIAQMK